jgi:hypothetical protein
MAWTAAKGYYSGNINHLRMPVPSVMTCGVAGQRRIAAVLIGFQHGLDNSNIHGNERLVQRSVLLTTTCLMVATASLSPSATTAPPRGLCKNNHG